MESSRIPLWSISYEQLFCSKVFCTAFMYLQFRFVIFWQKNFGAKAAHKLLVKLTPGRLQTCRLFCKWQTSLIFAGKARSLPLEWNPVKGSTLVGSSRVTKYWTRVEVANTLAYYYTATITAVKSFIAQARNKIEKKFSSKYRVLLPSKYSRKSVSYH